MNITDPAVEIAYIIIKMREYQKNNDVKRQCITNAQYLYDILKINKFKNSIQARAVLLVSVDDEKDITIINNAHMVVVIDDVLYDPSYETFNLKNKMYFFNVKDFIQKCVFDESHKDVMRDMIKSFLKIKEFEKEINDGGLVITDKVFYNNQADYIEKAQKEFNSVKFLKEQKIVI